jgi:hypothetical protein
MDTASSVCREKRELANVAATVEISVAMADASEPGEESCEGASVRSSA